jgi:putative SOS response-associated peptidase YedK
MCGRAKLPEDVSEIKLDLAIDWDDTAEYRPRWNVAPTSQLPVVVARDGRRTLTLMRWGLVPPWAKSTAIARTTFNARAEDVRTRPAFRAAWQAGRRCLVIADAYYEWRATDKQPFAVALANRGPMTFAGLWESWCSPATDDPKPLQSFAILTTTANALLTPLHDRMPVILAPEHWPAWLGETVVSETQLLAMLRPYPAAMMNAWPVHRRVGNVRNDEPDLLTPLAEPVACRDLFDAAPHRPTRGNVVP